MPLTIRPAEPGDMADLGRIYVLGHWSAYRGNVPRGHLLAMDPVVEANDLTQALNHPQGIFVVVQNSRGRVVGFAYGGMTNANQAGLSELFVERAYRGRGAAQALLVAFAQRVLPLGASLIRGPVAKCNLRSRGFCTKTGAVEVDLGQHFPLFSHVQGLPPIDMEAVYEDWHDVASLAAGNLPNPP